MSEADHNVYDKSYKTLFSDPKMIRDLITGFVDEDFIQDIDLENIEKVNKSFISESYKERESDLVLKLNLKGREAYIYFLIEFQSTPDKFMALRTLTYILLFYDDLINQKQIKDKLPPVFPIILYTGNETYTSAVCIEDLIELPYKRLMEYIPKFKYYKIALNEIDKGIYGKLISLDNIVAACFNLITAGTDEEAKQAIKVIKDMAKHKDNLTRIIMIWLDNIIRKKNIKLDKPLEEGGFNMLETVLENAVENGMIKKAISVAIELKKLNLSVEEISRITGLSVEEINKLKEE